MPTSYTSLLGLALPVTGELSGTWGDTVNDYISKYVDSSVAGTQTISGSQTAVTLTVTNGVALTQVGSGASGSAQYAVINCTGNPAGLLTITAPASSRNYLIINATSTSQSVKIVGAGPTTGVTLVSGESAIVAWNGTDYVKIATSAVDGVSTFSAGTTGFTPSTATSGAVTLGGTLATTNGGTGLTSFTANRVFYASSTSAIAQSANLTFDGTTLTAANFSDSSLTSGRVTYATTGGNLTDSANLTFDGTSLTLGGNPTLSAGTANGVAYLNASKVLTTGSALTFDGTNFGVGTGGNTLNQQSVVYKVGANAVYQQIANGSTGLGAVNGIRIGLTSAGVGEWYSPTSAIYYIDNTEQMRLTSTGLGIGTSSPGTKLDVVGGDQYRVFRAGTATGGVIEFGLLSQSVIGIQSLSNGGNFQPLILQPNSGNVGIGTSSPTYKLSVNSGATTTIGLFTSTGSAAYLGLANSGATTYIGNDSTSGSFIIQTPSGGFSTKLTLDNSGNLGLGVTPFPWAGNYKAFDFGFGGALANTSAGNVPVNLTLNSYFNGTNWVYKYTGGRASRFQQTDDAGFQWFTAPSGTAGSAISFSQAMTLTQGGNLLVGTTTDVAGKLQIATAANNLGIRVQSTNDATIAADILTGSIGVTFGDKATRNSISFVTADDSLRINVANTERARITSGGNLLVGTTSDNGKVSVFNSSSDASQPCIYVQNNKNFAGIQGVNISSGNVFNDTGHEFLSCNDIAGGGVARMTVRSNGGIANYQANDINLSDRREKTNFAPAKAYLDTICSIPVQTFNYIDQSEDDPGLTLGVVAQDVQAVAPELVHESDWGNADNPKMRLSIYQTDLQYALMKCIQELKSELDTVKSELAILKGA